MSKRHLLSLPPLVLLLLLAPRPSHADDALTAKVMAATAAIPQRQADFVEDKQLAALTQPIHASGLLRFRHPDYLEKLTTNPAREDLVIYRDALSISTGGDAPHVVDLSGQPQFRAMIDTLRAPLTGDLPTLQRLFTVTSTGDFAHWHMDLAPRDAAAQRFVRQVMLDGSGADITRIAIHQANGDTDTLTIQPRP